MYKLVALACILLGALVLSVSAQNDDEHRQFCANITDCGECVGASNPDLSQGGRCYFCKKTDKGKENVCLPYGFNLPIASSSECPGLNFNIDNCTITALVYIILICVFVVLFFAGCCIICCCCCCWCHRRRQRQRELEDENYMQERDHIRQKSSERRAERKAKNDEIRKKYDLRP
ncbi:PREDICTED: pituitary tumor-transforming gene 1 protein-interacting protein-like isoform X2 [Amphimedon queenslandica]|uniref:PSI domain-containing protein n=1 Tax=Amphimedon queenslandica TaxID=400682 RepID=A0AAN0JJJ6_AMPQE|nr:PREDICTED: pituitary tumor-transforming gene 1 protein-interacting protein-like isoform X2 [Amphimedon queenslandica]|eukprot:XP_019856961.1 PREDICTED: pituitary tumor-transforming gene 1 protein-interacting protein-like isoform X2 [Amphimedon queenslandica]